MKQKSLFIGICLSFLLTGCTDNASDSTLGAINTTSSTSSLAKVEQLHSGMQRYNYHEQYTIPQQPSIPNNWIFRTIPFSQLEIPLPPNAIITNDQGYDFRTMQIQSDPKISLDSENDFIFYLSYPTENIQPHETFRDIETYFRSICNASFPSGSGDYALYYETSNHNIDIYKFYPNCIEQKVEPDGEIMNIRIMVLQYQNRLFQVVLMNPKFTKIAGEQLIETAILNIRPIKKTSYNSTFSAPRKTTNASLFAFHK